MFNRVPMAFSLESASAILREYHERLAQWVHPSLQTN